MYFITIKRMLEVCFSAHPNIQYRAKISKNDINRIYRRNKLTSKQSMNSNEILNNLSGNNQSHY